MFRLSLSMAVVAVAVAVALVLVGERTAVTRTGYRVAELERARLQLIAENRRLEAQVVQSKAPLKIYERAKALDIAAEPPEARLKKLRDGKAAKRPRGPASKAKERR